MNFVEYGKGNNEIVMMIHAGGLSWWNYRDEALLLEKDYHVILPIIDGHAASDDQFVSIESVAEKLIQYTDEHHYKIKVLCGLSLGAQIAIEMLSIRRDIAEYAIIESVSLKSSQFIQKMIKPSFSMSYGLINKKWFSKLQFKSLHIKDILFDDYYRDTCLISKEDMISFVEANMKYTLNPDIKNSAVKMKVIVGSREQSSLLESADLLCQTVKNATLDIKQGLYHGEYSLNHPVEYVKDLKQLIKS